MTDARDRKERSVPSRARKKSRTARRRAAKEPDFIEVSGAREHNLQVDELVIPKRELVVFTGVALGQPERRIIPGNQGHANGVWGALRQFKHASEVLPG